MSIFDEIKKQYSKRFNEAKQAVNFVKQAPDNLRVGIQTTPQKRVRYMANQQNNINLQRQKNQQLVRNIGQTASNLYGKSQRFIAPIAGKAMLQSNPITSSFSGLVNKKQAGQLYTGAKDFIKNMPRDTARKSVSLLASTDGTEFTPTEKWEKVVYGNETIKPSQTSWASEQLKKRGVNPNLATNIQRGLTGAELLGDVTGVAQLAKVGKQGVKKATREVMEGIPQLQMSPARIKLFKSLKDRRIIGPEGEIRMNGAGDYYREMAIAKSPQTTGKLLDEMADFWGVERIQGGAKRYVAETTAGMTNPKEIAKIVWPLINGEKKIPVNVYGKFSHNIDAPSNSNKTMVNMYGKSTPLDEWKPPKNMRKGFANFGTPLNDPLGNEAIPLYHGTNAKFNEFDVSKAGDVQVSDWGQGVYFTDKPDIAKGFAKVAGGDTVMERYAPDVKFADGSKLVKDNDFMNALDDDMGFSSPAEYLKEKGYGGVKVFHKENGGWNEYVVFDPKDIKDTPKGKLKGFANFYGKDEPLSTTPKTDPMANLPDLTPNELKKIEADKLRARNELYKGTRIQKSMDAMVTTPPPPITPTTPTEGLSGVKPNSLRIQTKPTRQVPSLVKSPESKMPVAKVQEVTNRVGEDVSFDNIISKSDTNVKDKVNIIDMFRTPDRVLNKIGLGEEAKVLRTQYDKYLKELPEEIDKIGLWARQTNTQENNNIFKFLDGQPVSLSTKEQKIAGEVQTYLKDWADKLKLPEDRRISSYITHIFDKDLIKKEFPEELAKIIDERVAGSVYDPFVLERLGKKGYIEDTWRALDAYAKRATRKYNIDEALEPIKAKAEKMELSQFKYVKNYIDRINMRPTEVDNMVDNFIKSTPIGYKLGQRPTTELTRNARQMVYRGTLGLNVGSTLKNLSQGANTYARLGERYTVKGYVDLFKNYRSTELQDVGILRDDLIQDKNIGVYKGLLSKLDKGLFYLFETAEKINRGAAYYGAKAKALNEGKTLDEAVNFAKKTVRDTQFTFGSIDTPPILQSDAAKTLLQFQSFNIKQGEFLGEMISKKDLAGLTRWIGASLAFVYGAGQAIGMNPKDIIPTIRVGGSPIFTTAKEAYNAVTNAPDEYGNKPENTKERFAPLLKSLVPLVPGGVQIKKTVEGLGAASKGYVETAKGLVRNPVTQNATNKVRGALFGQNNLPESQNYFDTKQSPLGKEQTNIFKTVGDKADYYKSVLSDRANNKEIDEIKKSGGGTTSEGTIVKKIGKEWKTFDTEQEAKLAITKDSFDKSGKKSALIDGTYYYKDKNGKTQDMPEDDFNMKVSTAKIEQAYDSKNYKEYVKLANEKLAMIKSQFENADPLTQIELQNDYNDLQAKLEKYAGYGGFKKGKKAKKIALNLSIPTRASRTSIKLSKPSAPKISLISQKGVSNGGPNTGQSPRSLRVKRMF